MSNPDGMSSPDDELLKWALPRLRLRWPGFRRVRGQVRKRMNRRMRSLGLDTPQAYRRYLQRHPEEWAVLDAMCRITVSRFYRDRALFETLEERVLPVLAEAAIARGEATLRAWSAGCGSGEEPYSLAIAWQQRLAPRFPGLALRVLATDASAEMIRRAERACYRASSLKELPRHWREQAFDLEHGLWRVKAAYRTPVTLRREDIREQMPDGPFDLILCRNVVFTYFDEALQRETLERLVARLHEGGALMTGYRERLPPEAVDAMSLQPWCGAGLWGLTPASS